MYSLADYLACGCLDCDCAKADDGGLWCKLGRNPRKCERGKKEVKKTIKNKEEDNKCVYCGEIVDIGVDGGRVNIPVCITNVVSTKVLLHNKCLNGYVKYCEATRPKMVTPELGERKRVKIS